jgi:hypothetical protein
VSEFAVLDLVCVVVLCLDCFPKLFVTLLALIELTSSDFPAKFDQHSLDPFRKEIIDKAIVVIADKTTTWYCDTIVSRSEAAALEPSKSASMIAVAFLKELWPAVPFVSAWRAQLSSREYRW